METSVRVFPSKIITMWKAQGFVHPCNLEDGTLLKTTGSTIRGDKDMHKFNLGRVNQKAAAKSFVKSQRLLPLRRCDLGRLVYLWEKVPGPVTSLPYFFLIPRASFPTDPVCRFKKIRFHGGKRAQTETSRCFVFLITLTYLKMHQFLSRCGLEL